TDVELSLERPAVERFDVLELMAKRQIAGVDLVVGQGVKHERIIGVGAVANGDYSLAHGRKSLIVRFKPWDEVLRIPGVQEYPHPWASIGQCTNREAGELITAPAHRDGRSRRGPRDNPLRRCRRECR